MLSAVDYEFMNKGRFPFFSDQTLSGPADADRSGLFLVFGL
jgi:hypothetical protein